MEFNDFNNILRTEYSSDFDKIRQKMMITSYFKYGPLIQNYTQNNGIVNMNCLKNLELRLQAYKDTGNTEFLADVANFAMIEFMYPSISGASYRPTDDGVCQVAGFGINEILRESEDN